jgi:hypothetical protein
MASKPGRSAKLNSNAPLQAIVDLAQNWEPMGYVERADALCELTKSRWSRRSLAKYLKLAEATIRWYLLIAEMSAEQKQAVNSGSSPTRLVSATRRKRAARRTQERLEAEQSDAAISRAHQKAAISWLERELPWPAAREQFLWEAEVRELKLQPNGRPVCTDPYVRLLQLEPAASKPKYLPELIEYHLAWFLAWLSTIPEREIRQNLLHQLRLEFGAV